MSRSVLISPSISEKSQGLMFDKDNKPTGLYIFKVRRDATKMEIKQEIEKMYNVEVESVNTYIVPRKKRIVRGRVGFTYGYKKAYVNLSKGVIPIFEETVSQEVESKKEVKEKAKKEDKKAKKESKDKKDKK
ncbi:MAG: uL23 family ribosomal protein [Brevinematia bacterium]